MSANTIRTLMIADLPAELPREPHEALRQLARLETELHWLLVQALPYDEHAAAIERLVTACPFSNLAQDIKARTRQVNACYERLHGEVFETNAGEAEQQASGLRMLAIRRARGLDR